MGTPEFAVPSLRALVGGGYNVGGVVTSPDKPAGRGQKIHRSEVKIAALELGLPVLQPEKLKAPEFVEALEALRPDLGIVIAFRMLPEVVWAMPRLGTFNLHASLLPQYRGAAPINWAIINGETETGVTTFLLNHEIDKGGIIGQIRVPILPEDNVGTLYERLMTTGTSLVTETVDRIAAGDPARGAAAHRRGDAAPGAEDFQGGLPDRLGKTGPRDREFRPRTVALSGGMDRDVPRGRRRSVERQDFLGVVRGRGPRRGVRHAPEQRKNLYPRGVRRRMDRPRRTANSGQKTARGARTAPRVAASGNRAERPLPTVPGLQRYECTRQKRLPAGSLFCRAMQGRQTFSPSFRPISSFGSGLVQKNQS